MITGIGIDIIEVERVAEKLTKDGFREKVFSRMEITYCDAQGANRAQHYAARFAAKEAFLKAMGKGLQLSHELHEIEVTTNAEGKPELHLLGSLATLCKNQIHHVSLTHVQATACAVVVIESTEKMIS
jgi:holo-[acyl-carrier protein] synthase